MTSQPMPVIVITGANGFIGKKLVHALVTRGNVLVRAMVRNLHAEVLQHANFTAIQGDLAKPETLGNFFVPSSTVVNLVYDFAVPHAENMAAARHLAAACRDSQVKRLIHCSTVAVYGRSTGDVVNEESVCDPRTEYGLTKLLIEEMLQESARGCFELVILRPTVVFGPGGEPLVKLANDLLCGSRVVNYLRSCLFSDRKMNLICVANVLAAIIFLAETEIKVDGEVYIVSEDDEPNNNFSYVERYLFGKLGVKDYAMPRIPLPSTILSWLLRARGRDVDNPRRVYDSRKIMAAGFYRVASLERGLAEFVEWYQGSFGPDRRERV